jgi:tryptophan halogenase
VQAGRDWDVQEFSFAVMAAHANRFDFPATGKPTVNSTFSYAYHFDASLYAQFMRRLCESRGVVRTEGKVRDVEQDSETGDIRALIMESGERIAGDFFIDCSGFRSLLLSGKLGVGWEDWSQWLPCDRAMPVPTERCGDLTPYTRVTAMRAGWRWRIPLQHRTGNGYVFSSRFTDEDEAREELLQSLDEPLLAEPRLLRFQAGRRAKSWVRNCVALGLSSGFLEPLESTSIYLIQIAVMHLISLMPARARDERLIDEFNRRIDLEYERIRDFLILHYHLNSRDDAEIWRYCRTMEVPDSLRRKMELFRHSGIIEAYKDGLFTPPSWLSVFVGQGMRPEHYNPLADAMPLERMLTDLDELRTEIRDRVDEMPKHASFIAKYANAQAASDELLHEAEVRL